MTSFDPHAVLGLAHGASRRDIKHAFRRLAMRWHPDRNADPEALEHFKRLRAAHDQLLSGHDAGDAEPGRGAAAQSSPRGADRHETFTLTVEQAYCGGDHAFEIADEAVCEHCGGSGEQRLRHTRLCSTCHGSGRVRGKGGLVECGACQGRGYVSREPCAGCGGAGRQRGARPVHVTVPRGTLAGDVLRVAGAGEECADTGGVRGDLVLRVELAPHALYRVEGRDLVVTRPLSALRMLLGGAVAVPLPDGVRHVKLTPGRAAPRELRIRGAGFARHGEPGGALIVHLVPTWPQVADPSIAPLLEALESRLADALPRHLPDVASWEARWLPHDAV